MLYCRALRPTIVMRAAIVILCVGALGCSVQNEVPTQDATSTPCVPYCKSQPCGGDNGCGGVCPNVCDSPCDAITGACQGTITCVSNCDGKMCGDDGCGTHCGGCETGQVCNSLGVCLSSSEAVGDTCPLAIEIDALPYTVSGTTTGFGGDYGYSVGACPGVSNSRGRASADTVYVLIPPTYGKYAIELNTSYDANLYVVTDCDDIDASCVAAQDNIGPGLSETLNVSLAAGTTYFVVVDGWSNYSDVHGSYTLHIDAGCEPNCVDKLCGTDGCGGECPYLCGNQPCDFDKGVCSDTVACPPPCLEDEVCFQGACCVRVCTDIQCGDLSDGCGGDCPPLCEDEFCDLLTNLCVTDPDCVPDCAGKACGSDGCDGMCPDTCPDVCDIETGICSSSVPPNEGACTNEEDFLKTITLVDSAIQCAMSSGGDPTSITSCLVAITGVSEGCATCYGALMDCMFSHCEAVCQEGETPQCNECLTKNNCVSAFDTCSGIALFDSAPPTPPPEP